VGEQDLMSRSDAPPRDRGEPSWPVVIRTTIRLWLERRRAAAGRPAARRRALAALTVVVVGVAAAVAVVVLHAGRPAGRDDTVRRDATPRASGQSSSAVVAAALTRAQAAGWIAQQVSQAAIVACDPGMCSVLTANGLPASQLLTLQLSATDPLGADVVVATPAVRAQFGGRLAGVYAPEVIASFGSGAARIDVRAVAPDGAAAYQAGLAGDQAGRVNAGKQLLRNKRIHVSAAARANLTAGEVDPRLLTVLAALAGQHKVTIASFGDPSPGAPDVPLRGAEIGAASRGTLLPLLSFLHAQRSPYLPAQAALVPAGHRQYLLTVRYDAPGPLGMANAP
jgi:hypothetical protein